MPRVFDNINLSFLPALRETVQLSYRADFCVGYFNLRGWKAIADCIKSWEGQQDSCVRLLVGMQRLPVEELKVANRLIKRDESIDNATAICLRKRMAEEFREQLTIGLPTNEDEQALKQLASQLRAGKLVVKLHLRHTLHAKLYLGFRDDPINPIIGFLGSSNFTLSGLQSGANLISTFWTVMLARSCLSGSTTAGMIDGAWTLLMSLQRLSKQAGCVVFRRTTFT